MLSKNTQYLIYEYLNLPFKKDSGIVCPYFNNSGIKQRAALRSQIGKGTPKEIVEEAEIISKQYGNDILKNKKLTTIEIENFLTQHHLGIDCSGLVSQILKSEKPDFIKQINFGQKNIWRKIITRLRPIENLSAKIYNDDKNTSLLVDGHNDYDWSKIQTLDLIIMLEMPRFKNQDHILLVTEATPTQIKYIHSRRWISEQDFESGVTEGIIKITKPGKSLLEQEWAEKNKTGQENETFSFKAKEAKILQVRRLNA